MYTKRFISLLIAIGLLAVVVLVVRESSATTSLAATVDSATRSYTSWAQATDAGANPVDSATRSYMAQAKAVACRVDVPAGMNPDSATRSYIAWGLALQAKDEMGALCR